jgi:nicotinate-nucleotide pyrophosphorylase (carboxylating)
MPSHTEFIRLIDLALEEDVRDGDHSTLACIPKHAKGAAELKVKEEGVVAGMEVAQLVFSHTEPTSIFTPFKTDGDAMKPGDICFRIEGSIHMILKCERLVLNCMQRMSGIATLTKKFTAKLAGYNTKLLDTRKTTPNFRIFEKEAVRIGGGHNHRMGLYDMIMLKDNHVDYAGGLETAIERTRQYLKETNRDLKIEVETRSLDEVRRVLQTAGVDRIMLDNFSPKLVREAVQIIDGRVETEASGGINLDNIVEYAEAGVDYVSVGGLIHQARSLDLSLKAVPSI